MTSYRSERTSNARSLRHRRTKPSLALPGRDAFSLCHSSPSSSILGSYNRASIAQDHFTTSPQVCGSSPGRRGARSGIQGQPALTTCSDRHFAPNAPYGFGNISIAFKSSATCGYPQRQVSSPLIAHAPRGKHFARLLPRVCERSRPATPLEDNPCLRHDMTRSTRLSTPIQSTKASYTQLGRVRVAVRQTEGGNEATKREGRAFKKIRLRDWSVNAPSTFFFFRPATFFFFFLLRLFLFGPSPTLTRTPCDTLWVASVVERQMTPIGMPASPCSPRRSPERSCPRGLSFTRPPSKTALVRHHRQVSWPDSAIAAPIWSLPPCLDRCRICSDPRIDSFLVLSPRPFSHF